MTIAPPNRLKPLLRTESGQRWFESLPGLLERLAKRWNLELGEPYQGCSVSYVIAASKNGQDYVLKIQWPHSECELEAAALECWRGRGAVRLLDHDPTARALLLEYCKPGNSLGDSAIEDKLAVVIALLSRLSIETRFPFQTLEAQALQWHRQLGNSLQCNSGTLDKQLIVLAMEYIDELAGTQGRQFLVHQDLHGDNILAAEREAWLAIDAKPLLAELEFAVAPVVRSFELGHSAQDVVGRLDRLCGELLLDRERARKWTIAQTIAWNQSAGAYSEHVDTIRWLMEAG